MAVSILKISPETAGRISRASGRRVRYAHKKPYISAASRQKGVLGPVVIDHGKEYLHMKLQTYIDQCPRVC